MVEKRQKRRLGPNRDQARLLFKDQGGGEEPVGQLRPKSSCRFVRYLQQNGTYSTPGLRHGALKTKRGEFPDFGGKKIVSNEDYRTIVVCRADQLVLIE